MNILIVSNIEWSNENAFGNTISNFFENIDSFSFASIYLRSSLPHNSVCDNYYKIAPVDIIRHFFNKKKIGIYYRGMFSEQYISTSSEKKIIKFIHKNKISFVYKLVEYLYKTKKWLNKKFVNFINEFSPDIIFTFAEGNSNCKLIIEEIKKIRDNVKLVSFIADNVYDNNNNKANVMYYLNNSNLLYGASLDLCKYYNEILNKKISPLYKCCKFRPIKKNESNIIKMVYAGNLLYGRKDVLINLIKEVNNANHINTKKIKLTIYSNSIENINFPNNLINDYIIINGPTLNSEIKESIYNADVVLHVESFKHENIETVKYSFSTKIIDCFESGAVLLAIGPMEVASIKYISQVSGALVASNLDDIKECLNEISTINLIDNKLKIREFAEQNHDCNKLKMKIKSDFQSLVEVK